MVFDNSILYLGYDDWMVGIPEAAVRTALVVGLAAVEVVVVADRDNADGCGCCGWTQG